MSTTEPTPVELEMLAAASGMYFNVEITTQSKQHFNLGQWISAAGFDVQWELADYRTGDSGNYRWLYPGVPKYTNVKIKRYITPKRHTDLRKWLESNSFASLKDTAAIKLFSYQTTDNGQSGRRLVAQWNLESVVPVKYTGPQLDASKSSYVTEELELAHAGWLLSDVQPG